MRHAGDCDAGTGRGGRNRRTYRRCFACLFSDRGLVKPRNHGVHVWEQKRRAFEVLAAQKHLWDYYTRVALNRGMQGGRNSGKAMTGSRPDSPRKMASELALATSKPPIDENACV